MNWKRRAKSWLVVARRKFDLDQRVAAVRAARYCWHMGLKETPLRSSNEDSQFLNHRRFYTAPGVY